MDTSKTYIKMCDYEELQSHWNCKQGDYYYSCGDWASKGVNPDVPEVKVAILDSPTYLHKIYEDKLRTEHAISGPRGNKLHVWLPRQDQIQEMMVEKVFAGLVMLDSNDVGQRISYLSGRFDNFVKYHGRKVTPTGKNTAKATYLFFSMEQLWLAFYMKEKHKKVWDGKKWIIYQH